MPPKYSVVIPVYKAEGCLDELYLRLRKTLDQLTNNFEIILVNDASPDGSWEKITALYKKDKRVKAINLSRNFGQHYAISAGLDYAKGDYVVVMDCDLQDRPEEIPNLYRKIQSSYDVIFAQREKRNDPLAKRITSKLFYMIYNYFTESSFDNSVANFSISRKVVIDNFRMLREQSRSFPLVISWMGFSIGYQKVRHGRRHTGRSSYTFSKLINLAIDGIISQSNKPLRLSVKVGFLMAVLSIIGAIAIIILRLTTRIEIEGWASLIVTLFFLAGLFLSNLGILGLYIGKVFDETKKRPLYIIKESYGIKK